MALKIFRISSNHLCAVPPHLNIKMKKNLKIFDELLGLEVYDSTKYR